MKLINTALAHLVLLFTAIILPLASTAQISPGATEPATTGTTPAILIPGSCRTSNVLNLLESTATGSDIILVLKVWTDGGVYGVKVEKSGGDDAIDRVARNLVESCRFNPSLKDGKPVVGSATLGLALTAAAKIDEASLRAEYAKRLPLVQRNYSNKKEYHTLHILLKTEDKAQTLLAEIVAGANFEDVARQHSIDKGSAKAGGDIGWGLAEFYVETFANALRDKTEPGLINRVVKSPFGWHLIRVEGIRPAKVPAFEDVRHILEKELLKQRNALVFPAKN